MVCCLFVDLNSTHGSQQYSIRNPGSIWKISSPILDHRVWHYKYRIGCNAGKQSCCLTIHTYDSDCKNSTSLFWRQWRAGFHSLWHWYYSMELLLERFAPSYKLHKLKSNELNYNEGMQFSSGKVCSWWCATEIKTMNLITMTVYSAQWWDFSLIMDQNNK